MIVALYICTYSVIPSIIYILCGSTKLFARRKELEAKGPSTKYTKRQVSTVRKLTTIVS